MSITTVPRGPKGHCLLGSLRDFQRDQLAFYASCAHDYGDVVPMRFGPRCALLLYHPDAIEEVLVTRNRDFVKSPGARLLQPLLGEGLLLSEGSAWLRQRRLVQPAFHRQRLAGYGETMTTYTERRLVYWKDSQVVDIHADSV
jgi:cytochrome P450